MLFSQLLLHGLFRNQAAILNLRAEFELLDNTFMKKTGILVCSLCFVFSACDQLSLFGAGGAPKAGGTGDEYQASTSSLGASKVFKCADVVKQYDQSRITNSFHMREIFSKIGAFEDTLNSLIDEKGTSSGNNENDDYLGYSFCPAVGAVGNGFQCLAGSRHAFSFATQSRVSHDPQWAPRPAYPVPFNSFNVDFIEFKADARCGVSLFKLQVMLRTLAGAPIQHGWAMLSATLLGTQDQRPNEAQFSAFTEGSVFGKSWGPHPELQNQEVLLDVCSSYDTVDDCSPANAHFVERLKGKWIDEGPESGTRMSFSLLTPL